MGYRSNGLAALALGAAAASWVLASKDAHAQEAGGVQTADEEEALGPEAGTRRLAAPDERAGHVLVQGRVGYLQPFGSIAADLPIGRIVSGGPVFGANLGLGVSRSAVFELSGAYALLPAASSCAACSGRSLDLGLGFAYHIAQGIAFDPWISFGVGYRMATFTGPTSTASGPQTFPDSAFHGLDVARVALGGDFYPVSSLGFGAFVEVDAGTYLSRPDSDFGRTTYGFLQLGLRVALDPLPRGTHARTTREAARQAASFR